MKLLVMTIALFFGFAGLAKANEEKKIFEIKSEENLYYGYPNIQVQEAEVWRNAVITCEDQLAVKVGDFTHTTVWSTNGRPLSLLAVGHFKCIDLF
ncbi:MAG: hypothetical protein R3B45_00280 [Bdellovibrionota bacterium]